MINWMAERVKPIPGEEKSRKMAAHSEDHGVRELCSEVGHG